MGSKNKLKRFRENDTFSNVIQPGRDTLLKDGFEHKGQWARYFGNDNPIVLELGCGKGEYSLELARRFPNRNHIGVDIKGARFWRGAKTALEEGIDNVSFLRIQIELLAQCFAPGEVREIWITFPDPQIKYTRQKHRLTNDKFLDMYRSLLRENGVVHLKTDSEFMHGYTLGLIQGRGETVQYAHHDIYGNREAPEIATAVQTFYEKQYLDKGKAITYLRFAFAS